jgi:hypothetical protein
MSVDIIRKTLSLKRSLPGDHLVENNTERIDVGQVIVYSLAREHLRRQVGRGSQDHTEARAVL